MDYNPSQTYPNQISMAIEKEYFMPLTILLIPAETSEEEKVFIRDTGATALAKATGIPEKNCHTVFLSSLLKGNNGPFSNMIFGVIITGFFKWWKTKQMKAGTTAIAKVVHSVFNQSVEIFALPVPGKASGYLKID